MPPFNKWMKAPPEPVSVAESDHNKIESALAFLASYSQSPTSAAHRAWVIDQITRILAGPAYEEFVKKARAGKFGAHTYAWDTGSQDEL